MTYENLKLDNQLCHRLYMASNKIIRTYRPFLDSLDLTYPQYVVMMALWEEDGVTIQRLLAKTAIDGGAMTLMLKKMQEKAYLSIKPSEDDKRKKLIYLSEAGRTLKESAKDIPEQVKCTFEQITQDDFNQLIGLLDKMQGAKS